MTHPRMPWALLGAGSWGLDSVPIQCRNSFSISACRLIAVIFPGARGPGVGFMTRSVRCGMLRFPFITSSSRMRDCKYWAVLRRWNSSIGNGYGLFEVVVVDWFSGVAWALVVGEVGDCFGDINCF